jgi:hypothetical protein
MSDSLIEAPPHVAKEDESVARSGRLPLPWLAITLIGLGLIAAPAIFQMFSRAPLGKTMIDEFRPFMNSSTVTNFEGYLNEIGTAEAEARGPLRTALAPAATDASFNATFPGLADFIDKWPQVRSDMGSMLKTMRRSIDNFEAVDALPEFDLFPWFFVVPGLLVAIVGAWQIGRARRGVTAGPAWWVTLAIGLGLVAAPAAFQMFTRAPLGGSMINNFRPLMNEKNVQKVQLYFLSIGGGEAELRTRAPEVLGVAADEYRARFPAIAKFNRDWPKISNQMAPMVGAMSDNIDNFQAVDALPPFPLFPWFFVAPGLLLAALAIVARRGNG